MRCLQMCKLSFNFMLTLAQQSLLSRNTLAVSALAEQLLMVRNEKDIVDALDYLGETDILLLGSGSNVILKSANYAACIVVASRGVEVIQECADSITVEVAAGENWHEFVAYCLQQGWHGLENLALIPGTVGAAPVQNIGAYGVEVANFIESLRFIGRTSGKSYVLSKNECEFSYRDSIFKKAYIDQCIISSVTFRLLKTPRLILDYAGLDEKMSTHSAKELFDAVVAIRKSKLPDPAQLPNVGSFFKNPIVNPEQLQSLSKQLDGVISYPQASGMVKLAAGYLIEQAGWKGYRTDQIGVHDQQALVLINHNGGNGQAVLALADTIKNSVAQQFSVSLEIEPRIY